MRHEERQARLRQANKAAIQAQKMRHFKIRIFIVFLLFAFLLFGANRLIAVTYGMRSAPAAVIMPQQEQLVYDDDFIYDYIPEEEEVDSLETETEQEPQRAVYRPAPSACAIDALDELLLRHGNYISVFFENLETGFIYRFNACRVYFSASVPKAAYALYIYMLAEKGIVNLDSVHEFMYADANWGSGIIQRRYEFGATFTLRELLRLNLSESDNVATNILRRIHGLEGYKRLIEEMGGNSGLVGSRITNSDLTANEAGLFAREIFAYLESGGRYSCEFKTHLLNNQFPFIVSDYPVASKTGWTSPRAWHDMAIVYAPSPFTLVILSAREGWSDADYADFAEISMAFQQFNDEWFVG